MSPLLELRDVHFSRGPAAILKGINLALQGGEVVGILGPNGSGKTTALRILMGLEEPASGCALLGGDPVSSLAPRERAQRVGYLPQGRSIAWPLAVEDVVGLGRFAFGAPMGRFSAEDKAAIDDALDQCGLLSLRKRPVSALSGGELARVHIARALAGAAGALVADEPAASLDPFYQLGIMEVLGSLAQKGRGVLVVLHDIALAARSCTRVILMKDGEVRSDGPPRAVLVPKALKEVFRIEAEMQWEGANASLWLKGRV